MSPARHSFDDEMDAATWCRHLVPDGSVYAFLADHRQELFPPALFADLTRQGGGHPSVPAEVVATVMVLQALEGLSDREAISALRRDIAWKVACGLRLDDEGFHPTVLVYWRNRIRRSTRPRRIFEAVRQVVEQTGVLAGRGRRVLDSTILADAVAAQDTVAQLVAARRPGQEKARLRDHLAANHPHGADNDSPSGVQIRWRLTHSRSSSTSLPPALPVRPRHIPDRHWGVGAVPRSCSTKVACQPTTRVRPRPNTGVDQDPAPHRGDAGFVHPRRSPAKGGHPKSKRPAPGFIRSA